MTVCYFGIYDSDYPRNKILIEGLRQNGVSVIECNSRALGLKKFFELYRKHKQIKNSYDIMVVGFMGQLIVPFAKILCRKKIVFDAFLSVYNSHVFDRKDVSKFSPKALYYYILDWLSVRLAHRVILDTNAHIQYFVKTFHVKQEKFERIWIGAYDRIFQPSKYQNTINHKQKTKNFIILWWGWYIPLHGITYILEAASLLNNEPIDFYFYGGGKRRREAENIVIEKQLKNVFMKEALKPHELVQKIRGCDIALGIFGDTEKTQMVIPNKVYEAFACRKAVITGDTPAAREILQNGKDCILCPVASGKDLAQNIMMLKDDNDKRHKLAIGGHELYKRKFTPKILGSRLKSIIEQL